MPLLFDPQIGGVFLTNNTVIFLEKNRFDICSEHEKKETLNMFLNNKKKNILLIFVCWQNTFLVRNTTPYVTLLLAATATSCLSVNFLLEYSTSPRYIPYILCSKHKSNHRSCVF